VGGGVVIAVILVCCFVGLTYMMMRRGAAKRNRIQLDQTLNMTTILDDFKGFNEDFHLMEPVPQPSSGKHVKQEDMRRRVQMDQPLNIALLLDDSNEELYGCNPLPHSSSGNERAKQKLVDEFEKEVDRLEMTI